MNAEKPAITVVEDEAAMAAMLRYNLEHAGFEVTGFEEGEAALRHMIHHPPRLALLDWMLPGLSGIEICRQLRRRPETRDLPVIMLTARAEDSDSILGLDAGADDYIGKPFSTAALLARVRAVMRRRGGMPGETLRAHGLRLEGATRRAWRGERPIRLGPTEYKLLEFLMRHPGRVFSREELLRAVWGEGIHVEPRTIDVHVRRLRLAINGEDEADLLRTVRSAGYALDPGDA